MIYVFSWGWGMERLLKWANFIWLQNAAAQRAWRLFKEKQDGCQVLSSAIVP